MRAPKMFEVVPEEIKSIWITHLPNFSINEFKVLSTKTRKNGDVVLYLEEGAGVYENMIVIEHITKFDNHYYKMKKSYHLTEAEASIRLRDHFRALNANHTVAERIVRDSTDKDMLELNIEKFMDAYPEMTI